MASVMSRLWQRVRRGGVRLVSAVFSWDWALRVVHLLTGKFRIRPMANRYPRAVVLARQPRTGFQILIYHRITDTHDGFLEGLPPSVFSRQMEYLARFATVLSLSEVVSRLEAREDLPPWTVVVTFDDGYRDNYDHAFPILKRFGIPATIFLVSDYIGNGKILWHDLVFWAFNTTRRPFFYLPEIDRRFDLQHSASRQEAQLLTRRVLRRLPEIERDQRIATLQNELGVVLPRSNSELMLDWGHVREMAKEQIDFGSHTATHPILTTLPPHRVVEELTTSKKKIEQELGTQVDLFAYPNGMEEDFNSRIQEVVQAVGYRAALSTLYGVNSIETPRFALRRFTPWEMDIGLFAFKLNWFRFTY